MHFWTFQVSSLLRQDEGTYIFEEIIEEVK